jgi:hypothetical protein
LMSGAIAITITIAPMPACSKQIFCKLGSRHRLSTSGKQVCQRANDRLARKGREFGLGSSELHGKKAHSKELIELKQKLQS